MQKSLGEFRGSWGRDSQTGWPKSVRDAVAYAVPTRSPSGTGSSRGGGQKGCQSGRGSVGGSWPGSGPGSGGRPRSGNMYAGGMSSVSVSVAGLWFVVGVWGGQWGGSQSWCSLG